MISILLAIVLNLQPAAPIELAGSDELVRRYEAQVAGARRRLTAAGPPESIAGELARREHLYQARLAAVDEVASQSAQRFVPQAVMDSYQAADAADVAYLRSVLPADGWFRKSRDGASTPGAAWILLQHVGDPKLMEEVARRIEPLVALGEVDGRDFAYLHDRAESLQNRRQRYGSQYTCVKGKIDVYPIIDPEGVDDRRKKLGLPTMAENARKVANLGEACPHSVPTPTN
jgi:hypothetical protein